MKADAASLQNEANLIRRCVWLGCATAGQPLPNEANVIRYCEQAGPVGLEGRWHLSRVYGVKVRRAAQVMKIRALKRVTGSPERS